MSRFVKAEFAREEVRNLSPRAFLGGGGEGLNRGPKPGMGNPNELLMLGCYGTSGSGKSTRMGQLLAWLTEERGGELQRIDIGGKGAGILWLREKCLFLGRWVISPKSKMISWASMDTFIRHERGGVKSYPLIAELKGELGLKAVCFEGAVEVSNTPKYTRELLEGGVIPRMSYTFIEFSEGEDEFRRNILSRSGPNGKAGNSFKLNKYLPNCRKRFVDEGGNAITMSSGSDPALWGKWVLDELGVNPSAFIEWSRKEGNSFLRDWGGREEYMKRWGYLKEHGYDVREV